MGMEKEFEMMLQKRLEDSEKKMLGSAACTPFRACCTAGILSHAIER
ncbi:MAG: hypothetical protein WCE81_00520 [Halobacteriota archaeon]